MKLLEVSTMCRTLVAFWLVFLTTVSPSRSDGWADGQPSEDSEFKNALPCPLDPGFLEVKAACALAESPSDACAWIPIVERLVAGDVQAAAQGLRGAFGLPESRALGLVESLGPFTLAFVHLDCDPVDWLPLTFSAFDLARMCDSSQSEDTFLLLAHIFDFDQKGIERAGAASRDRKIFDRSAQASRGFTALMRSAGQLDWIRAHGRSEVGRQPATLPETLPPDLSEVDRILTDLESRTIEETREELDALASAVLDPSLQGRVLARAGFGLFLLGRMEDGLVYLKRAESVLSRASSDPLDQTIVQMVRAHVIVLLKALERHESMTLLEARLQSSEPSDFVEILLQASEAGGIDGIASILEALSSFDFSSEEASSILQAIEILIPRGERFSSGFLAMDTQITLQVFDDHLKGDTRETTALLEELAVSESGFLRSIIPAISAALSSAGKDLGGVMTSMDQAVRVLESSLESHRLENVTDAVVGLFGHSVFALAAEAALIGDEPRRAFAYAERGRAFSMRKMLGDPERSLRFSPASAAELALEERIVAQRRTGRVEVSDTEDLYRQFAAARFERQVEAASTRVPRIGTPGSLEELRAVLGPDETILVMFIAHGRLWKWRLDAGDMHFEQSEWSPELARALDCEVANLRWAGAAVGAGGRGAELIRACSEAESQSGGVLDSILTLQESPARPGDRLMIVPYGPLHQVPWTALRSASERPLVEDFEIAVLPSADTLLTLRSRREPADAVAEEVGIPALVLGDPVPHLAGLDAARREAGEVAAFLGVEALVGDRASETVFWREAPDAAILHIAAHGVYEAQHPLFSRLQLAEDDGNDGFLHVHEIWDRLDLRRNRLVVLSACETAAGDPTRGDDIVGLTQAFLVAGAPAVISTLWPVDDPASAELMTTFYRHFRRGATAGESLRRAQLEMMRNKEHSAPYFWAGYTLVGDPETRWLPPAGEGR